MREYEPALILKLSAIRAEQLASLTSLAIETLACGIRLGLAEKPPPVKLEEQLNAYFSI